MTELKQLLPRIIKVLESLKKEGLIHSYALIGGMAVATRGFPRATKDLDFLINTEEDFFRKAFSLRLRKHGFITKIYRGEFDDPLRDLIRILDRDKTPLVDLILVHWRWQVDMVNSAEELSLKNIHIPIVRAEDLIVLKLKAGSNRDLLDIEELIKVVKLDKERLFLLAKTAGVDKKLNQVLLQLKIPLRMAK